jgi:hypothetical protein
MSYLVTAPLVIAKDQAGKLHHVYEGGVIPWLSDDQAEHFVSTGLVKKVGGDVGPVVAELGSPTPPPDPENPGAVKTTPEPGVTKPPQVATKDTWVEYAVARGFDRAEAEDMTKAELIEALG